MKQIDLAIRIASGECDETIEKTRKEFWKTKEELFDRRVDAAAMLQKYCVLVMPDKEGKISGTIIFPRDPKLREKAGTYYDFYEGEVGFEKDWNKVLEIFEKQQDQLVMF